MQSHAEILATIQTDLPKFPLIAIVGPTAVGKTTIAIGLAQKFQGEIVSADSRLFYRGMDIGTDKPTREQRQVVPHHLIDIANPDEIWSLALYQVSARHVITDIHGRDRLPFLVGGTGQYIHAVIEGWSLPQVVPDPRLRRILETWSDEIGREGLHARLAVLDPDAASSIDLSNLRRTIRALEVILTTGRPFSSQKKRQPPAYNLLVIGLIRPRSELYARIDARIDRMITDGLIDEVNQLLRQGYSPTLPTMSAIGYQEIVSYLQGKMPLKEAIAKIKRRTHMFVRRQANWFKLLDPRIHWFDLSLQTEGEIERLVYTFLKIGLR